MSKLHLCVSKREHKDKDVWTIFAGINTTVGHHSFECTEMMSLEDFASNVCYSAQQAIEEVTGNK